jgi:type IV pilus biogenesis protein CpaD/CtpE
MTRIILTTLVLLVAGCANTDPYRRTDVWYPTGSNAGNIAAMVARPNDLILGRTGNAGDARQATSAIDRVWQDRAKPLASETGSSSAPSGASGSGGTN